MWKIGIIGKAWKSSFFERIIQYTYIYTYMHIQGDKSLLTKRNQKVLKSEQIVCSLRIFITSLKLRASEDRGSYMVLEINMGACPRLEFDYIRLLNCLGYDFYFYGAFEFLCNFIANLWRHEWYHYNTKGYPVLIISKVINISCNGRRNVLLNNYIIDKFVVTKIGFVCIRILGGHSFLWHCTPIFNCIFCIQSNLE